MPDDATTPPTALPRRLAFCITELDPGGAERALAHIATRLDPAEWTVQIYCLGPETDFSRSIVEQGIPVICLNARSSRDFGVVNRLTAELQVFRPHLLQCFLFHANIVGRIAGRRAGVPVIVAGHRVADQQKRWREWLDWITRNKVDHHVCVSMGVRDHVEQTLGIPPEQLTVIPNGVEIPAPAPQPAVTLTEEFGFPPEAKIVLGVGRLHPQKNFLTLLDAFQQVHSQTPDARLLIVGEGPQRARLERRIQELNLQHAARLAGWRSDVPALMRQSNVFALTSLWEGMPNVLLEAMAVGLTCVCSDVEGIADVLQHEVNGLIVRPPTAKHFGQEIQRVLCDPVLATHLSHAAQHTVIKHFTWDSVLRSYASLYRGLLQKAGKIAEV